MAGTNGLLADGLLYFTLVDALSAEMTQSYKL